MVGKCYVRGTTHLLVRHQSLNRMSKCVWHLSNEEVNKMLLYVNGIHPLNFIVTMATLCVKVFGGEGHRSMVTQCTLPYKTLVCNLI